MQRVTRKHLEEEVREPIGYYRDAKRCECRVPLHVRGSLYPGGNGSVMVSCAISMVLHNIERRGVTTDHQQIQETVERCVTFAAFDG